MIHAIELQARPLRLASGHSADEAVTISARFALEGQLAWEWLQQVRATLQVRLHDARQAIAACLDRCQERCSPLRVGSFRDAVNGWIDQGQIE